MTDAQDYATGVRATMLRGGTSRGLYFEPGDLPTDPAVRNDLLLRLMGTPDPRQIDGLGGSTSLTSKVAVVGASEHSDADVDYLFLQLGVDEPTISDQQNCGNILAGVGRSPSSAGSLRQERRRRPCGSAWSTRQHRRGHVPDPEWSGRVPRGRRHRRGSGHGCTGSSPSPTPKGRRRAACCPPERA